MQHPSRNISGIRVDGLDVDSNTRCGHYHSARDIIAIKFKCCGRYYSCYKCHDRRAGHAIIRWHNTEFDTKAILCGVCGSELSIREYLACNTRCPYCQATFNDGCRKHWARYFEL